MKQYLDLLDQLTTKAISEQSSIRPDRTGTGTTSIFGTRMEFDLQEGFPMLTTKRLPFKVIAHELLWFLKGTGDTTYLKENNVKIWDEWDTPEGLGPVYGVQWRRWTDYHAVGIDGNMEPGYIDQIKEAIDNIRNNPTSRRIVVSAWNVSDLAFMALPPCHMFFQFYVDNGRLSCQIYQRSADIFLGVPFNIASYALLTHMVARVCRLDVGSLIWVGGDTHLYSNHIDQAITQLVRRYEVMSLPKLEISYGGYDIDSITIDDLHLEGYNPLPHISAPVSV